MIRLSSVLSLLISVAVLGGCSAVNKGFSDGAPQLVAAPDSVSAMLADAADRAAQSMETLAAVEYSRTPTTTVAPVNDAPPELRRAVTVNWIGPVETIAKTLADRASYNFLVIGNPTPLPIVVSIDAENMPVIDVMRDVGLQLGVRGNVKVDSSRKIVEIHYPPNTGVGREF